MAEFLPEGMDEEEGLGIDPNQIVTLRTSDGSTHYIAVEGPMTLAELKRRSDLNFGGNVQVFLNNAVISDETVVPAGATIVAVGSVKGG